MSIEAPSQRQRQARPVGFQDVGGSSLLPPYLFQLCVVLFLLFGIGPNVLLALMAIATLLVGSALLWRPGEAPTLLLVFVLQWIQAATGIFHANAVGLPINDFLSHYSESADTATALSLIALVVLALGIRLVVGPSDARIGNTVREIVLRQPARIWLVTYAVVWAVATASQLTGYLVPGLSQVLLTFAGLKWGAFVVLTISAFAQPNRSRGWWMFVFLFELGMSFGGFFASFKDVFFFTLIGIAAAGFRVSLRMLVGCSVLVAILFALGIVWTAVKGEYRDFVSRGSGQQVVLVGTSEGLGKLYQLLEQVDGAKLAEATSTIFKRLSYVEFFGAAIDHVPHVVEHQYGIIWWDAISRPFMPRLFFSDKLALDDSEMTRKYTGVHVGGSEDGTSISIGFIGESYIDFGEFGMMVPIFALGLCMGCLYRWFVHHRTIGPLFGTAMAAATLMTASRAETTAAKTFGGLAVSLVVCWLLAAFVLPRLYRHFRAIGFT